jgi:hypothetical protein
MKLADLGAKTAMECGDPVLASAVAAAEMGTIDEVAKRIEEALGG